MAPEHDLLIVGSGFGGTLLAMIARRLGLRVLILERGRHPRFAIGESSTPLAGLLWEEIARDHDLPRLLPLSKWGTWQAARPELPAGIKRGFSFVHHVPGADWRPAPDRSNTLLVAASPNERSADTQWYRPALDHFLLREAIGLGADYVDRLEVTRVEEGPRGIRVHGMRGERPLSFEAGWLVDATGPRGLLHRHLGLGEEPLAGMPATRAVFSHFRGVARWDALHPTGDGAPFPPDDAALHHVFPGGWIWVLRFNNGITSAGAVLQQGLASELGADTPWGVWRCLLDRLPSVAAQFAPSQPVREAVRVEPLPFRTSRVTGSRWVLLPAAAGFVDPLLSTGIPLTLLGVQRLGAWLAAGQPLERLDAYAVDTLADLDAVAALMGALHAVIGRPAAFQSLTHLYFAAASFSETARRLGRPGLAPGFLLREHPVFGHDWSRRLAALPGLSDGAIGAAVREWIRPVNIAGLADDRRGNWYPALASDLHAAADLLGGASRGEIDAMLARAGFVG